MANQELTPAQKSAATKQRNRLAAEAKAQAEAQGLTPAQKSATDEEAKEEGLTPSRKSATDQETGEAAKEETKEETKEGTPAVLTAVKGKITNLVTGERYLVGEELAPAKGLQHWENRQIEVGLLKVVS